MLPSGISLKKITDVKIILVIIFKKKKEKKKIVLIIINKFNLFKKCERFICQF